MREHPLQTEQEKLLKRQQNVENAAENTLSVSSPVLTTLPQGRHSQGLRQAAVVQMQRQHGNAFVRRQLEEYGLESPSAPATAPSAGASGQTSIGDGSATVTAEGGNVNINAAMIHGNAAMADFGSGIIKGGTLIVDTVIASTYTPGAGNVY